MIIDFHTHCFPDNLAKSAMDTLSAVSNTEYFTNGTISDLKSSMKEAKIDYSVVLNIVVKPHQTEKTNLFAKGLLDKSNSGYDKSIIPFASIHPDDEDWMDRLVKIKADGFKGIKLHPAYQGFSINDYKMEPIYKEIAKLDLILVFHAGIDIGYPDSVGASPDKIADVLPLLEKCKTVLAHMGAHDQYMEVLTLLCGKNIFFDTSYSLDKMGDDTARNIIRKHGVEKILFGTDSPWVNQAFYVDYLKNNICKGFLSGKQVNDILGNNASSLLSL